MLDIDQFKSINDKFGPMPATTLSCKCRDLPAAAQTDVVARFGGEFLLLLPETQMSEARVVPKQLRQQVEASVYRLLRTPSRRRSAQGCISKLEHEYDL
jgi:diguanylate cyclase (GGDEF)-like protein